MISETSIRAISYLLSHIRQPARLQILLAIGEGEACVCHLEALLGYRQAYISQHLMAMRKAGLLTTRRKGHFIFYRLQKPELLKLIYKAGEITGISPQELNDIIVTHPLPNCCCPQCVNEIKTGEFIPFLDNNI